MSHSSKRDIRGQYIKSEGRDGKGEGVLWGCEREGEKGCEREGGEGVLWGCEREGERGVCIDGVCVFAVFDRYHQRQCHSTLHHTSTMTGL